MIPIRLVITAASAVSWSKIVFTGGFFIIPKRWIGHPEGEQRLKDLGWTGIFIERRSRRDANRNLLIRIMQGNIREE